MSLNGARGMLLAVLLGPRTYGLFGTLVIVQQYLSYVALGIREGVAIRLAQAGAQSNQQREIESSSLFWGICSGALCALCGVLAHLTGILPSYAIWVGLIALCSIVNEILININRHEQKLVRVASLEFVYHGSALVLIALMWDKVTVEAALQAILTGLVISMAGYAATLRSMRWQAVSMARIVDLIRTGLMPAVLSAVVIFCNTFFVIAANWLNLGSAVGVVVLAGNISVLLLFGLNTIAWGLVSKSMSRHYLAGGEQAGTARPRDLGEIFLQFGVVGAVLGASSSELLFSWILPQYSGASVYILHFCLFQSYGLLLFSETNFLNVNSRIRPVALGYAAMLLGMVTLFMAVEGSFLNKVQVAIVLYFILALSMSRFAVRLGFSSGSWNRRAALLCFPVSCAVAYQPMGTAGVALLCVAVLCWMLYVDGRRVFSYVLARGSG